MSLVHLFVRFMARRYRKQLTVEEAQSVSFPDGNVVYRVAGKSMKVHCDQYHTHRFSCLIEVKH